MAQVLHVVQGVVGTVPPARPPYLHVQQQHIGAGQPPHQCSQQITWSPGLIPGCQHSFVPHCRA